MLRSLKGLERFTVHATDGEVGSVADVFLNDDQWVIRYLVVKTGGFLDGRQVLISPISFRRTDWSTRRFHLALTMRKVRHSPGIDTDLPVSRQLERAYHRYHDYPYYWSAPGLWGAGTHPDALAVGGWSDQPDLAGEPPEDPHLRSAEEIAGYHLQAIDGPVGQVADFLVDDESWEVRYLVVRTSRWWAEDRSVLVSPHWATSVSWAERELQVDLTRRAIKRGPSWNAARDVSREYETRLHRHYGRPVYWEEGGGSEEPRHTSTPRDSHQSM